MTFKRVNEHTVQCIIEINEIDQMGYVLQELYTNSDLASDFMKSIMEKGIEAGFNLSENIQDIQAILLSNQQLILSFTDVNPEESINLMLENFLATFEAVEKVGKDQLEEMLKMTGKEKIEAFQETMEHLKSVAATSRKDSENAQEQEAVTLEKGEVAEEKEKYILRFSAFSDLEKFCKKVSFAIPASVYKDESQYYLLADPKGLARKTLESFVFQSQDFVSDIKRDSLAAAFIEEHASRLIEKEPIELLKKL